MRSALDTTVPLGFARDRLQPRLAVQGNLDPIALLVGGAAMARAVAEIRAALGERPVRVQSRARHPAADAAGTRRRAGRAARRAGCRNAGWAARADVTPPRGRADEFRRAGLARRGAPVSLQSVQRQGDHPPARAAAAAARGADRVAPGADRTADLCPARRRLAAARQYAGAGARAGSGNSAPTHRCFIAMRYWHPLTAAAVSEVKQWDPDEIVLLPLYPQFSTTTTQSSLAVWEREARRQRLEAPTRRIRSYPDAPGFIAALAASTRDGARCGRDDPRRTRSGCCSAPMGCRRRSSRRAIPIRARSRPPPPRCCARSTGREAFEA